MIDITGLREDKRPQSSTIVHALLDRLEAAEKAVTEAYQRGYAAGQEEIETERDALRVKIAEMERQEPGFRERCTPSSPTGYSNRFPLYALPGAQPAPSAPNGWLRAIDEALVVAHIGVANPSDTYEQARVKLDSLIGFHADVATDPTVNGGWKLVPIEPTQEMRDAWTSHVYSSFRVAYQAMIAAAMGAKP